MPTFIQRLMARRGVQDAPAPVPRFYGAPPPVGDFISSGTAMRLSTVYACVDIISDSVAQLPLEPYVLRRGGGKEKAFSDPAYELLNHTPAPNVTRFTFLKVMVVSMLLEGNAYAVVERNDAGDPVALHYVPSRNVAVVAADTPYGAVIDHYGLVNTGRMVEPEDMVHLLNFTYDGIRGLSTLTHAAHTLGLASSSEGHARNFFRSGASLTGLLTVSSGRLRKEQREEIRREWYEQMNADSEGRTGIPVLDMDIEYKPITIKPQDSQLLETRKFNVPEICRFFKVSPVKVHDLTHSSYSTVEATNMAFLLDTLSPHLVKIEEELRNKLWSPRKRANMGIDFDTSALLRADVSGQANLLRTLSGIGAMSPNEVRAKYNLPPYEGGDDCFMQLNMQKVKCFDTDKTNEKAGKGQS